VPLVVRLGILRHGATPSARNRRSDLPHPLFSEKFSRALYGNGFFMDKPVLSGQGNSLVIEFKGSLDLALQTAYPGLYKKKFMLAIFRGIFRPVSILSLALFYLFKI